MNKGVIALALEVLVAESRDKSRGGTDVVRLLADAPAVSGER